jgi:hypothetical protein
LSAGYQILRELDADHPLVIIQAPRGNAADMKPYNNVSDIMGMDIYPVGYPMGKDSQTQNKNESLVVGDLTSLMKSALEQKSTLTGHNNNNNNNNDSLPSYPWKGLWMTLQIGWSGIVPPHHTIRFPTFHQERFMTYQAIIHGARMTLGSRKWNMQSDR